MNDVTRLLAAIQHEFEKAVTPARVKTIQSFQYDEIAKEDGDE